ncbi:phospholipase ABHD3-like [Armigeres subalbatus]|uniref:phospholipase ABHD3-like n=1 Tax=Armigeres subalbatus TaxID=124917 RepID=UPI002ECFB96D
MLSVLFLLVALLVCGYFLYYETKVIKRPLLAASSGPFRRYLCKHVPIVRSLYYPTWWCIEGRAQTLVARIVRAFLAPHVRYQREIFVLSDGGKVALDWFNRNRSHKRAPLVVILPGLLGDSNAEYVKYLVKSIISMGAQGVVLNNRGLAGVELSTPRLYSACSVDDLSEVLNNIRLLQAKVKIAAVGISMGGLILGNYLVRKTDESKAILTAAYTISLPWNMFKGSAISKHEILWHKKYDWNMDEVMNSRTIREFDANFTAKHSGFSNLFCYYSYATLHDKLFRVQVPLLCLNAADDPFQPLEAIPVVAASKSSHVAILVTARGGHIGFLDGMWPADAEPFMCRLFRQFATCALFDVDGEFRRTSLLMLNHLKKV